MKPRSLYIVAFLLAIAGGCQKQGPVDLIDDQTQNIVVSGSSTFPDGAFGTEDIDPSRLFPPVDSRVFGQLIVAGSTFDSGTVHHEASLTRAIFFDRSSPVVVNSDTVGYKTLNAGTVGVDAIPLIPREKRLQNPRLRLDTLLGVQYSLVSKDGVGGRGFQFLGSHAYQWSASGFGSIAAFVVDLQSPPSLHIDSPAPDQTVSLSHNLRVRWTGGGPSVEILISEVQSGVRARPLVRLRLNSNQGGTVIPSAVLQILRNHPSALFTFTSGNRSTMRVSGYPDPILAEASSTHNILLSLSP